MSSLSPNISCCQATLCYLARRARLEPHRWSKVSFYYICLHNQSLKDWRNHLLSNSGLDTLLLRGLSTGVLSALY